jgi:hypothetical protein
MVSLKAARTARIDEREDADMAGSRVGTCPVRRGAEKHRQVDLPTCRSAVIQLLPLLLLLQNQPSGWYCTQASVDSGRVKFAVRQTAAMSVDDADRRRETAPQGRRRTDWANDIS